MREAGRAGDQPWPPTSLAAAGTDRLLELRRELPRRTKRAARAIKQTGQAPPGLLTRIRPAPPPAMRRRRRHPERRRSLPQRCTILDPPNQREPTSQSELGVSVQQ